MIYCDRQAHLPWIESSLNLVSLREVMSKAVSESGEWSYM